MDRRTLGGLVPGVSLIDRDHLDRVLCIVLRPHDLAQTSEHVAEAMGTLGRVFVHAADLRDAAMAPWVLAAAYEGCERLQHIWGLTRMA
jgi:hypothetical protein